MLDQLLRQLPPHVAVAVVVFLAILKVVEMLWHIFADKRNTKKLGTFSNEIAGTVLESMHQRILKLTELLGEQRELHVKAIENQSAIIDELRTQLDERQKEVISLRATVNITPTEKEIFLDKGA